jgi:hypothetical protein
VWDIEQNCPDLAQDYERWNSVFLGRQRPTLEMVESAAQKWPNHAFWLVTGLTLPDEGHEKPPERTLVSAMTGLQLEHQITLLKQAFDKPMDKDAFAEARTFKALSEKDDYLKNLRLARNRAIAEALTNQENNQN